MIDTRKKLADSIIEEFKRLLENGVYKEGDKLPNQFEFAKQLGVSRQSLREAMHTLQLMGVVTQKPKVGTVVVLDNPKKWIQDYAPPLLSDYNATTELIEARKLLEPAIMAVAVERITPEEIEDIKQIILEMKKAVNEKDYIKLDVDFHFKVAIASQNRYLKNIYMTIINNMEQFEIEVYQSMPEVAEASIRSHSKIAEDIITRNKEMAILDTQEHIANIEELLEKYYSNIK